jgi:hypothetical protein
MYTVVEYGCTLSVTVAHYVLREYVIKNLAETTIMMKNLWFL